MIEYDRKLVSDKIEKIAPKMKNKFEEFSNDRDKIEWTRKELIKHFENKEAPTVLATIDCFIGITGLSGKILGIQQGDNINYKSIEEISEELGCEDTFYLVIGEARAFHFFD